MKNEEKGNDVKSETGQRMDIIAIESLVSATDPGGLAMYVAMMTAFLGSVALARLREDVMKGARRRRR